MILIKKLLYDVALILIISFSIILLAESLLPTIITSHLSLLKLLLLLLGTLAGIVIIEKKTGNDKYPIKQYKKMIFPFVMIILFLLIGNSLLRFSLLENIFITTLTLVIFIIFYQLQNSK
ncbi:MAG: hypothetical protein HGA61_01850 [Candidatus Moranbacteria bacterium]|nr:hypothetical protein [Candidatus Moranbacteria bacterium]